MGFGRAGSGHRMNRFKLILGPCAIESRDHALKMAERLAKIAANREADFYYKSSFDKANRTAKNSPRGVGMEAGLAILAEVRRDVGVKTLTDVHEAGQCARVAQSVDVLQIPAFLCRQTDLLQAAAATGRPVNVKKGQFLAPWDMKNVVDKLGDSEAWITERGTTFGYNALVVDFRGLEIMRALGRPVIFDATHSVQEPGGRGDSSGGQRRFIPSLARAAAAVGCDGLFMEAHDDPDHAISDAASQIPLDELAGVLDQVDRIRFACKPTS